MQEKSFLTNGFVICTQAGLMQIDLMLSTPNHEDIKGLPAGTIPNMPMKNEYQGTVFMSLETAIVLRNSIDENLKIHESNLNKATLQNDIINDSNDSVVE